MPTATAAPPEIEALEHVRVVPVVTVDRSVETLYVMTSHVAGGLPVVEITLRTPAGIEALRISSGLDAVLGAGTFTTAEDAARVIEAGARFAVFPGIAVDMVTTWVAAARDAPWVTIITMEAYQALALDVTGMR